MKKQYLYSFIFLLLASVSCSKADDSSGGDDEDKAKKVNFTANITTRVSSSNDCVWEAGDRVGIFTLGNANVEYKVADAKSGVLEACGDAIETNGSAKNYNAYYPYDATCTGVLSVDVEKMPTLLWGSASNQRVEDVLLSFKHQYAKVTFKIKAASSMNLSGATATLQGAYTSAKFNVSAGNFSDESSSQLSASVEADSSDPTQGSATFCVVPTVLSGKSVTLTLNIDGDESSSVVADPKWRGGQHIEQDISIDEAGACTSGNSSILDWTAVDAEYATKEIFNWDFDGADFSISPNKYINDNGYGPVTNDFGTIPCPRLYGGSATSVPQVSIISSKEGHGDAVRLTLGDQDPTDIKAKSEYYLHVCDWDTEYISDCSFRLDENFTPVDLKRLDDGPSWCIIRQWHQSAPESPPISIGVDRGTTNSLYTKILYGKHKSSGMKEILSNSKIVKLGQWYNLRVHWKINPGSTESFCKVYISDTKRFDDLDNSDVWFNYKGQIGYTLEGKPEDEITPLSYHIKECAGLYQNTHVGPDSFHSVMFDDISISEVVR